MKLQYPLFEYFTMIDFDGITVGFRGDFSNTSLEFSSEHEAVLIIIAWNNFIRGGEVDEITI